jgi:hypothetical protein
MARKVNMCWICDTFTDEDLVEQYTEEQLEQLEIERIQNHSNEDWEYAE